MSHPILDPLQEAREHNSIIALINEATIEQVAQGVGAGAGTWPDALSSNGRLGSVGLVLETIHSALQYELDFRPKR